MSRRDRTDPGQTKGGFAWRRRWTLWLVLVAAVLAGVTLFAAANYAPVELRLLIWEGEVRVSWIGLAALAIGIALGMVGAKFVRWR